MRHMIHTNITSQEFKISYTFVETQGQITKVCK